MVFLKYAFCMVRIGSGGGVVRMEFKCSLTVMENLLRILWGQLSSFDMCHLVVYLLFRCLWL
jgi:hypothetical protein